jgi:Domain of unknown function (DUF4350)
MSAASVRMPPAEPRPPASEPRASVQAPPGGGEPGPARRVWRRWRVPLVLIGVIVLGGVAIAAISTLLPPPRSNSYLDPASSSADGTHALTDILGERGFTVVAAYSTASALAALGTSSSGHEAGGGVPATLVITSPYLLTHGQLARLGRVPADLFVVEPGPDALAALAPRVGVHDRAAGLYGQLLRPGCALKAAIMAGTANVGGSSYRSPSAADGCYLVSGFPTMVRLRAAGRTITILGSGALLTDGRLAGNGNAALALNLLAARRHIVWLTPEPPFAAPPASPGRRAAAGPALIPWQAWLVVIQLGIAVVLVGLWRCRRLGPLITERLPVVVRASETVEGHAALYQSRRARDRAAAALREDLLARLLPVLGLASGAPAEAVTGAVAARSARGQQEVARILYGQTPGTDAGLVDLARSLDELEREVCTS